MTCPNCQAPSESAASVRACYAGQREACGWEMAKGWNEDGRVYGPCGAHVTFTERGWTCEAGHEHVSMQARHAEGWDFAEEYGEAMAMARAGVEPRTMSGHVVTGPESFAGV